MQFIKELKIKIISGKKTQTRRIKCPYKVGQLITAQNGYRDKAFGKLLIKRIRIQHLSEITESDAKKEGFKNRSEFIDAWKRINGTYRPRKLVYVIDFKFIRRKI